MGHPRANDPRPSPSVAAVEQGLVVFALLLCFGVDVAPKLLDVDFSLF
jgi:hypothetical protein